MRISSALILALLAGAHAGNGPGVAGTTSTIVATTTTALPATTTTTVATTSTTTVQVGLINLVDATMARVVARRRRAQRRWFGTPYRGLGGIDPGV
jgi:hypothetical protein